MSVKEKLEEGGSPAATILKDERFPKDHEGLAKPEPPASHPGAAPSHDRSKQTPES